MLWAARYLLRLQPHPRYVACSNPIYIISSGQKFPTWRGFALIGDSVVPVNHGLQGPPAPINSATNFYYKHVGFR
jgi:hypothetical protein